MDEWHAETSPPLRRLSRAARRSLFVLVALNLLWRTVRYFLHFPMWGDEAFVAVAFFDRSYAQMLEPLEYGMVVPIGFLWLNTLAASVLGLGELGLRFVPWLVGLLSMFLFVSLSRRMLDRRAALIAIAIFAAAYYPVRHSTEVKPYSFDLLIALAVLWPAWWVWLKPHVLSRWIVFTLACIVAVWCSYPVVFVAGGAVAFLTLASLKHRKLNITLPWLTSGVLLCASFIAMYLVVGTGQAGVTEAMVQSTHWEDNFPPWRTPWKLPLWLLETHTGNMMAYPFGGRNGGSSLTFIMVLAGIITLWKKNRPLLTLLLAPVPLYFIAGLLERYPYGGSARIAMHLAPSICLLAGCGLLGIFQRFWSPREAIRAARIVPIVMAGLIFIGLGIDIVKPYKKPSDAICRETVQYLTSNLTANDRLLVFGRLGGPTTFPDFLRLGGSGARLRYDLEHYSPVEVEWGPELSSPGALPETDEGQLWLLEYHDNKVAFPQKAFDLYLIPLRTRYGQPQSQTFDLKDRGETIILHHFQAARP